MSLQAKLQEKLTNATLPGSVRVDMTTSKIAVDGNGSMLSDDQDVDCTLTLSEELLQSIADGDTDPMGAYFSGDLKVTGDLAVAMALSELLKA